MIGRHIIPKKAPIVNSQTEISKGAKRIAVAKFQSRFIKYSLEVWM